jgi:hypothetical protein
MSNRTISARLSYMSTDETSGPVDSAATQMFSPVNCSWKAVSIPEGELP